MSGTSHDGTDAVIAGFGGDGCAPRLFHHCHIPHPAALRRQIASAFEGGTRQICELNFSLGEAFASAAIKCATEAKVPMRDIAAIASHGQTICHVPPAKGRPGSTLQIGEPAVIARRTSRPVVSNFRAADIAAGGQGAPLVPYADWVIFGGGRRIVAVHNIGGISNLTLVTPRLEDVIAFDTGPGNCLMDETAMLYMKKPCDRNGAAARRGKLDEALLRRLMSMSYIKAKPPKSTGRETFNLRAVMALLGRRDIKPDDLICTLAHFTAASIADAYERFVFPSARPAEIVFAGGGTENVFLMGLIREAMPGVDIGTTERYGIPSAAREALCFAVLANETLSGRPSNVPSATGALQRVVLGSITMP